MIYNSKLLKKNILSIPFYIIIFIIFLIPYSISGLSANYSFILLPIIIIFFSGKIKRPSENFIIFILFFLILL